MILAFKKASYRIAKWLSAAFILLVASFAAVQAQAQFDSYTWKPVEEQAPDHTYPDRLPRHVFVLDQANMISPKDEQQVNAISGALLNEHRIPIYVVTVNSLAEYGEVPRYGELNGSIERYAASLFDHWGIGFKDRNYGMLLLISKSDRRMRIELGHDWAGRADKSAAYLVDRVITPRFKAGLFSEGIVEGASGMNALARGLDLPSPYYPVWVKPAAAIGGVVFLFIGFSLVRSGNKGWGYLLFIGGGLLLGWLVERMLTSAASSGVGYGSGGSGGFSGGGGATGGW